MAGTIREKQNGFTIIELMTVMVVLAILAAIIVPGFISYIDKQKTKECKSNQNSLVLYLKSERIKDPETSMQEVIDNYEDTLSCPSGGVYTQTDKDTVSCNHSGHGSASATAEETSPDYKEKVDRPKLPGE